MSLGNSPATFKQKLPEGVDAGYPDAEEDMARIVTHPGDCPQFEFTRP